MRTLIILMALAAASFGQRHKMEDVDAEKPEGKLLQQALQEGDSAKKAALLEQFAEQFPKRHRHTLGAGAVAGVDLREGG